MNLSSLTVSSALGNVLYHMSEKEALSSLSKFEMFVLISGCISVHNGGAPTWRLHTKLYKVA